jgi:hypothetical protein
MAVPVDCESVRVPGHVTYLVIALNGYRAIVVSFVPLPTLRRLLLLAEASPIMSDHSVQATALVTETVCFHLK